MLDRGVDVCITLSSWCRRTSSAAPSLCADGVAKKKPPQLGAPWRFGGNVGGARRGVTHGSSSMLFQHNWRRCTLGLHSWEPPPTAPSLCVDGAAKTGGGPQLGAPLLGPAGLGKPCGHTFFARAFVAAVSPHKHQPANTQPLRQLLAEKLGVIPPTPNLSAIFEN